MKRPKKLAPEGNELRPETSAQDSCTNPSPLAIAAATIEQLEAENAKLRSGAKFAPLPNITTEERIFNEWQKTQALLTKTVAHTIATKARLKEARQRIKLLNDRLMAMQLVADQKEKAQ